MAAQTTQAKPVQFLNLGNLIRCPRNPVAPSSHEIVALFILFVLRRLSRMHPSS